MVTAEEAIAGALVLKNKIHHSAEKASNSDQEGNSPALPKKPSEDGYNWRKYGQKNVKRNEYIRSYYKCSYHNCQVKKQVENAYDGQITDTTYFGEHDHPKPQNSAPITIPSVVSVKVQIADTCSPTVSKDKSSVARPPMLEEVEPNDTNKLAIVEISSEGRDQAFSPRIETKDDENKTNKLVVKRRKKSSDDAEPVIDKTGNKSCHVVETVSAVDVVSDGYRWRKYGQKLVKGNQHPRSYYRCSNPGCPVKKHVERAFRDPKVVITTYEGKHIHDIPAVRTILPHGKPPSLQNSNHDPIKVNRDNAAVSEKHHGEEKMDAPTDTNVGPESGSSEQRTPDNMDVSSCLESEPTERKKPDSEPVSCGIKIA
ncbi:hypothetical protein V2J09_000101 [Rumex salicifolius]